MKKDRKQDHIELAFNSQIDDAVSKRIDLYYEPLLSAHPDTSRNNDTDISISFVGHKLKAPIWISSMTGGTAKAKNINMNLAHIANKFGFGMALGSCRPLLDSTERKNDFDFKTVVGDFPFYANLGVAQLEQLISANQLGKVKDLLKDLSVDGLVIHVNPLQEWVQPEGDRFKVAPIETIKQTLFELETNIIVKEVGQGFGPNSLISLMNLPISAIEFAGYGGTNFTALELARHNALSSGKRESLLNLSYIGHTSEQMISWVNDILKLETKCKEFIISGGINNILQGHRLRESLKANSVIGMASAFLKYAENSELLEEFASTQVDLLKLAKCYLKENNGNN